MKTPTADDLDTRRLRLRQQVGEAIRARRDALAMSRDTLAQLLGSNRQTILNIESGRHALSTENLIVIAGALETTIAKLVPPSAVGLFPRDDLAEMAKVRLLSRRRHRSEGYITIEAAALTVATLSAFLLLPGVTRWATPIIHPESPRNSR